MTTYDAQGRPEPPIAANETETLLGFLDFQRATFEWHCRGLDGEALQRTTAASTMTLGGMIKHLTLVENYWLTEWWLNEPAGPPWDDVHWDADRDWEWHSAADDSPQELMADWKTRVERSRRTVDDAISAAGQDSDALGALTKKPADDKGFQPSLRWILVHLIEEYARHNGHADLIRESIDGQTGE
jgi:uncharacterized damage-inducible protein DinB